MNRLEKELDTLQKRLVESSSGTETGIDGDSGVRKRQNIPPTAAAIASAATAAAGVPAHMSTSTASEVGATACLKKIDGSDGPTDPNKTLDSLLFDQS